MPNWCEGTLKVRGKIENIRSWVKENITCYKNEWVKTADGKVEPLYSEIENSVVDVYPEFEDEFTVEIKYLAHIKSTRRHFILKGDYNCIANENGIAVLVLEFQSAWAIDTEPFTEMSKQYNVDFRIYGCECGMQFNQEVIIECGELIKNEEIKFDDYEWECPFPHLGG